MQPNRATDPVDTQQDQEQPTTNAETRRTRDVQHESQEIRPRLEPTSPSLAEAPLPRTNAEEGTRPSAVLPVANPSPVMEVNPLPFEAQPAPRPHVVPHNQPQQQFVMPPSPPLSPPSDQDEPNQVNENEEEVVHVVGEQEEEVYIMTKIDEEENVASPPVVQLSSEPDDQLATKLFPSSTDPSRDGRHRNDRVDRRQSPYNRPARPNHLRQSSQPLAPRPNANQFGGDNVNGVELSQPNFNFPSSASSDLPRPKSAPLKVDTRVANEQFARQHAENVARRKRNAQLVWARIQANDYKGLFCLLHSTRPDLNVFIDGQAALHQCLLLRRQTHWCRLLVFYGANPNLANLDGWHPIHMAASFGPNETLKFLIRCNSLTVDELYKEILATHENLDLDVPSAAPTATNSFAASGSAQASLSHPCV